MTQTAASPVVLASLSAHHHHDRLSLHAFMLILRASKFLSMCVCVWGKNEARIIYHDLQEWRRRRRRLQKRA